MPKNLSYIETPFSNDVSNKALYPNKRTVSKYISSYDGTKLACDITFPLNESYEFPSSMPVILLANRRQRRNMDDVEIRLGYDLVPYGYIFVSFELRGCGVSYGINNSFGNKEHCGDVIAIADWIYSQSWCSGKIGMLGCSNRAYIQLCTASYNPRKISAITPVVAVSDFYYQNYPNGVSAVPDCREPVSKHKMSKEEFISGQTLTDDDVDGNMAYEAYESCHYGNNRDFFETLLLENLNRDSRHPNYNNEKTGLSIPPFGKLKPFFTDNQVFQHQFIGELESGTLGQLAHFIDFGGSVTLGPWTHFEGCSLTSSFPNGTLDIVNAYRQWYDHSLKGCDNYLKNAPAVSYYMIHSEPGTEWRFSESWPPENEVRTALYLCPELSGTCQSVNDGSLSLNKPCNLTQVTYKIRDDIVVFDDGSGHSLYNRSNLVWDGDMTVGVDNKGITFTSAPLFSMYRNEFAGCISLDLWISCTSKDVDLIVYAEEVLAGGESRYIKDGVMRASHRTSAPNPAWEKMGATWHTSMTEDIEKCLKEGLDRPTNIKFAIDPAAYHFSNDSRLRITITCANKNAFQHYMYKENDLPVLTLYLGGEYASNISVPFLEQDYSTYKGLLTSDKNIATLYAFKNFTYLYHKGYWQKFPNNDNYFTTKDNCVLLGDDSIEFHPLGMPSDIQHLPFYDTGNEMPHPFPSYRKMLVSTEKVSSRDYTLFVPGKKSLFIDLFKSNNFDKQPCIIYVHGYGCPYNYLTPQLKLMLEYGYAVAAIDIRNYPPNEFPDYIHDAKGAVRFLRANAAGLGLDPDKFGIYGASLGGNTSLMVLLTGDNPNLEGSVGGNIQYSSRVQAGAAGFAWSDLLNIGKDIADEYANDPEISKKRLEMTDGEFSPSSEVIGFAGVGKGLGILRKYKENGCNPANKFYDEKLKFAEFASPINHVNPSVPPIALFGGHGETGVNIAFKQSLKTFEALNQVDALTFLYGNTNGKYGEKPETLNAILAFFHKHLMEKKAEHILSVSADTDMIIFDHISHKISEKPSLKEGGLYIKYGDIKDFLKDIPALSFELQDEYINLSALKSPSITSKFYDSFNTIIIKY